MKTHRSLRARCLTTIALLSFGAGLHAAPLTWFPGPSLNEPTSGAATIVNGGNNILIGGTSSNPESLAATNLYWSGMPSLGGIIIAPGAMGNGDPFIVYGGTDGTNSTSAVIAYSPSGDTNPPVASMSVARSYLGYAAVGGTAYAIGGLDDTGQALSSAESYNADSNIWTRIASLPTALYDFPAVFNGSDYIYTFGGYTDTVSGIESATVLRYSISSNKWTAVAPMPIGVAGSAAALGVDGKIYVVGGVSGGVTTPVVQVYNPAANSWVISTPLPEALSAAALGVDSLGRLIVMGGMDANGNDVSDVWRSQQLGIPDAAPVFTQFPGTNGAYLAPYNSSIAATGNPPPTYLLVSGPTGMQVDADTGAITWTPQAGDIGTNSATIRATNYAGFADWTFSIVVPNPPPTILTNLAFVNATETSVTLSWDPESPVVGPVTYRVYLRHVAHSPKGSGATIWYTQIGSTVTDPTIIITGLTPGLSQSYYVTATGSGGTSGYAAISATTLSPQPPTNMRVIGLTSTSITLAWDPSPGPVPIASYEVWGWINNGVTSAIYGTGITNTQITITGLVPGSVHEWGVRAHDAGGYASGFDYGPTVVNPVPAPATLANATPASGGNFQFTASEGGSVLQTVVIQASTNPADSNSWVQIGSLLPATNPFTFTDTNANLYPMRFYRVIAP